MNIDDIILFLDKEGVLNTAIHADKENDANLESELSFTEIDWTKIFPEKGIFSGNELGDFDYEFTELVSDLDDSELDRLGEDPWQIDLPGSFISRFLDEVENEFTPEKNTTPFDHCAWYSPIHFNLHDWGIYIKSDCIESISIKIAQCLPIKYKHALRKNRYFAKLVIKHCMRAAFCILYLHEFYHHIVESFGIRLQTVQGRGSYVRYKENVYHRLKGNSNQLEEALANAYSYRRLRIKTYSKCLLTCIVNATELYMKKSFPVSPPGYDQALKFLKSVDFKNGEHELQSRIQEGTLNHNLDSKRWINSPNMMKGLFNCRSNIYEVVTGKGSGVLPPVSKNGAPLFYKCFSTNEMIKGCIKKGWFVTSGGKGSHTKLKKAGFGQIIIPRTKELKIGTQKSILKTLKINETQLTQILKS